MVLPFEHVTSKESYGDFEGGQGVQAQAQRLSEPDCVPKRMTS